MRAHPVLSTSLSISINWVQCYKTTFDLMRMTMNTLFGVTFGVLLSANERRTLLGER